MNSRFCFCVKCGLLSFLMLVGAGLTGCFTSRYHYHGNVPWDAHPYEWEMPPYEGDGNSEEYNRIVENSFLSVRSNPLSTFSIDVDTASYANCRRFINEGRLPPPNAVRIEEFINYFKYDYPAPEGRVPISIASEMGVCPWNNDHKLLLIGLQGKSLDMEELPPSNLVFLLDVSGSMSDTDKLPLLKSSMRMMVKQLRPEDRVAIVIYASTTRVVLESTSGEDKKTILSAIDKLHASGATAGGEGIQLAYKEARKHFVPGGNNRVVLASDGDFNVGISSQSELIRFIEEKRDDGIFLTVLGFGTGNLKDSTMEQLADNGNGNYSYIDSLREAKKALVTEFGGTMFAIAKDVKVQIEFNPATVESYRLIGYENRMMRSEDFNDDKKDAGEMGAGHQVTALYEIIPAGSDEIASTIDPLKYQSPVLKSSSDLLTLKLRYKKPADTESMLIEVALTASEISADQPSDNMNFASAVAEFGMLLRDSDYKGEASYENARTRAKNAKGDDPHGNRAELIKLIKKSLKVSCLQGR